MLPVEQVIGESGLSLEGGRARVEVRLPWYRSLPLSTVRVEKVAIDEIEVPLENASFELGARSVHVSELQDLTNDFWFVLDSAFVTFLSDIQAGSTHRVDVSIAVFPPYIPGMKRTNSQSEMVTAGGAR